ncbi:hypothetical protein [Pseudobacteriovorax antillogorgiicola]|uniref:Uncharacterized protein n=1 Tax=Pseudobacteriovorax antillogorgiicola TaxID=1513793 RepID=A0A1Y6C6P9_9BACT|nr:hypothetical protein [Pseudobacteriovorax antillogorgiicola]TCS49895.1 hypothetical protein EDD56_114140 [Pseudobacteriovorax antillogorgiicola]SMF44701.1 hypothetical protein SAMN06296036_113145 [Pseudobacteriovorax antillogorgiicola]
MKFLLILILNLLLSSELIARNSEFGPFTLRYAAFQVNGKRMLVQDPIRIEAHNTVNGRVYVAEGRNPSVEIPPGHYRFKGFSNKCKFKDRYTYIFKSRNVAMAAICS